MFLSMNSVKKVPGYHLNPRFSHTVPTGSDHVICPFSSQRHGCSPPPWMLCPPPVPLIRLAMSAPRTNANSASRCTCTEPWKANRSTLPVDDDAT